MASGRRLCICVVIIFSLLNTGLATPVKTETCNDWDNRSKGKQLYINNAWNKEITTRPYKQCLVKKGEKYGWSWLWRGCAEDLVFSYPQVLIGAKPWDARRSTFPALSAKINSYKKLRATVGVTTTKFHGQFNLALEGWVTTTKHPQNRVHSDAITTEVMWILHSNAGAKPPGRVVTTVRFDKVRWNVHKVELDDWRFIIFRPSRGGTICRKSPGKLTCKKTVSVLKYLKWAARRRWINGRHWFEVMELGNEIYGGCRPSPKSTSKGTTIVDKFSVKVAKRPAQG